MIKELCDHLQTRISNANLPFVETVAGVVKAVTYIEPAFEDGGKSKTITLPVSWHTNTDVTGTQERDLVPDSNKRGIMYFEENGVEVLGETSKGTNYLANVVLVSWYNKDKIGGGRYTHLQSYFIQLLRSVLRIDIQPLNLGRFTRVVIRSTGFSAQDAGIFSRYTYNETDRQYLLPPYECFAMRLQVTFTLPARCIGTFDFTPTNC